MGPILLVLLFPIFPWVPTVVGSDMDVGSDKGDETGVADVVLGLENEGLVVESGDDTLQIG